MLLQASVGWEKAGHATEANDTVRTSYAATPSTLRRRIAASVTVTRTPRMLSYDLVTQRSGTDVQIHTAMRLQPSKFPWKPAQQILMCGKGVVCVSSIVLLLSLLYTLCVGLPAKKPCNIKSQDNHMPINVRCYLMVYNLLLVIGASQYVPCLPIMAKEFNADEQVMSFSVQGSMIIQSFAVLVIGVASDRLGRVRILLGGSALQVIATFGCGCATDIKWFFFCRILGGLGESASVLVNAIMMDYFPDDTKRVAMMGLLLAGTQIAGVIAPVFGGFMANEFGWRLSFLFLACLLTVTFCFGLFCLVESSPDVTRKRTVSEDARAILQDRHLMTLLMSAAMLWSAMMTAGMNIPYIIENEYGKSILATSCFLAAMAMISALTGGAVPTCMPASNLQGSKITLAIVAVGAALITAVAFSFTEHFESIFSLLPQTAVLLLPYIYMSTMIYAPAADFAGMMAAFEGSVDSLCMALFSMLGTKMTVLYGAKGLMLTAACVAMGASIIFWAGFGCDPPTWALDDDEKDQASAKEVAPDSLSEEKPVALQQHAH